MPTLLKNLELEELSLVDTPANPLAMAPLYKRDTSEGAIMEDINKMTDDEKAEMDKMSDAMKSKMKMYMDKGMGYAKAKAMCNEDMKKSLEEELEKLKAENETLRKGLIDNGLKLTKDGIEKAAPKEYIEVEGESILKSDIPAPILKRLEEAEAEKADAAITKKASEELPNFDQDVAKALVAMDLSEEVVKALKAADALFEGLTQEVGKSDAQGDMSDPEEQIKKYAKDKGISVSKAYTELAGTEEGRKIINKIYEAKKDI